MIWGNPLNNNQKNQTKEVLDYVIEFEKRLKNFLLPPLGTEKYRYIPTRTILNHLREIFERERGTPSLKKGEKKEPLGDEDIYAVFQEVNQLGAMCERLPIVWISQFIWDDLSEDLLFTDWWPVSEDKDDDKDKGKRYEFVSSLIRQEEFRNNFPEPMSEIMFKLPSSPRVIELSWLRNGSGGLQDIADTNAGFALRFNDIGNKLDKVDGLTRKLSNLCDEVKEISSAFDNKLPIKPEYVAKVVQKLKDICEMAVLNESEENTDNDSLKAEIFEQAKNQIDYVFKCLGLYNNQDPKLKDRGPKISDRIPDFARLIIKSLIWNRLFDDEWQYLYYVPALLHDSIRTSGMVLACKDQLNDSQIAMVSCVISRLSSAFHFNVHVQQIKNQARRAAAAGILSRNMSHNIGSHVLPRVGIERLEERLKELHADELIAKEKSKALSFLRNKIDSYIQKKADFIAETTTAPLMSTKTAMFFRETIISFLSTTALIDTIANNEGFGYCTQKKKNGSELQDNWPATLKIKLFTKIKTGDKIDFQLIQPVYSVDSPSLSYIEIQCEAVPYAMRSANMPDFEMVFGGMQSLDSYSDDNGNRKKLQPMSGLWSVALPGPNGEFALYSILENIIRNSAKHNHKRTREANLPLDLQLWIGLQQSEDNDFYELEIFDTLTTGEELVETVQRLTEYLELDIIDDKGELRKRAWGIAEIMICANLLKGELAFTWYDDPKKPTIRADHLPKELHGAPKEECLVYRFLISKARQAIFIGEELTPPFRSEPDESDFKLKFENAGILFFKDLSEFVKYSGENRKSRASFQFIVLSETEAKNLDELDKNDSGVRNRMPYRIIIVSPDKDPGRTIKGGSLINHSPIESQTDDPAKVMQRVWEGWLKRWTINEVDSISLNMFFGNFEGTSLYKEWKRETDIFNDTKRENSFRLNLITGNSETRTQILKKIGSDSHRIIYDRHADLLKEAEDDFLSPNDRYIYFDKQNVDFSNIYSPAFPCSGKNTSKSSWLSPYQLIEAGLLRVLIIDERIAQRSMRSIQHDISGKADNSQKLVGEKNTSARFWHLAERAGVWITTHLNVKKVKDDRFDFNPLHEQSWKQAEDEYSTSSNLLCPYLYVHMEVNDNTSSIDKMSLSIRRGYKAEVVELPSKEIDLMVIHQGVIDILTNNKPYGVDGMQLVKCLPNFIPWVIIESGRGVPPEVYKGGSKFLPFSLVDSFINGVCVAKLGLAQSILELTRQ